MGILLNGVGNRIKDPQNAMKFILPQEKPKNKKVRCARWVADFRPQKEDPYRTRMTCMGNRVHYNRETATETAELETVKIHTNHNIISSKGGKFGDVNMGDFYVNTFLAELVYMQINKKEV